MAPILDPFFRQAILQLYFFLQMIRAHSQLGVQ